MQKNAFYFLSLLSLLVLSTSLVNAQTFSGGGNGTATQPYIIQSKFDLDTLAKYVNEGTNWSAGKHFLLSQNLSTTNFGTVIGLIGTQSDTTHCFQGYFHGNGKTIKVNITNGVNNYIGLFGGLKNGLIENLTVIGNVSGGFNVAGIVGYRRSGSIINCTNSANILGSGNVAGIVAVCDDSSTTSSITNCKNTGGISSTGVVAAGICAVAYGIITNCLNSGAITGTNDIGGIIATNVWTTLTNCANTGNINGQMAVGGICGSNQSVITKCINTGIVSGINQVGGICGSNFAADPLATQTPAIISTCHNAGLIVGSTEVGGICGKNDAQLCPCDLPYCCPTCTENTTSITNSLNTGAIVGNSYTAAIVGRWQIFCANNPDITYDDAVFMSNNFYDKQISLFNGIVGRDSVGTLITIDSVEVAEGRLTKDMLGASLSALSSDWTKTAGLYPYINIAAFPEVSLLAATPFILDSTDDRITISHSFYLEKGTNVGWASRFTKLNIQDTLAIPVSLFGDTLVATLGSLRRVIPINIEYMPVENMFHITAYEAPPGSGVVTVAGGDGHGYFELNDTATITATPNPHYTFIDWEEEPSGTHFSHDSVTYIKVTNDHRFRANFQIDTVWLTLRMEPDSMGYVFGGGAYDWWATAYIIADPFYGYHFVHWTDELGNVYSDSLTTTIYLDTHRILTGHFEIDTFTVDVRIDQPYYGTCSGSGRYIYKDVAEIRSNGFDTCYKFAGWYEADTLFSAEQNFDLVVDRNYTLVGHYTAVERIVSLKTNPPELGELIGAGSYDCKPQTIEINVNVDSGYRFVNWTDDDTGEDISNVEKFWLEVTRDYNLTANLISDSVLMYIVSLNAEPAEGGTVNGSGAYEPDDLVTITATPDVNNGFKFVYWEAGGQTISNSATYTFNITQDTALTAHFSNTKSLAVTADPAYMGTVKGNSSGIYTYNALISMTASPSDTVAYEFKYWSSGDATDTLSKDSVLEFNILYDTVIVAHFGNRTGINYAEQFSFAATPNPVDDILNITFTTQEALNAKIVLIDAIGKEVLTFVDKNVNAGVFNGNMDVQALTAGTYYIKVHLGNRSFTEKIIIK